MNRNCQISAHDPANDPNLGLVLHGYGSGYIEIPRGFRILTEIPNCSITATDTTMFRCDARPVEINTGAFPIYEYSTDLLWDRETSFLVGKKRYKLVTEVACKNSGVYIFYGKRNVKKSD